MLNLYSMMYYIQKAILSGQSIMFTKYLSIIVLYTHINKLLMNYFTSNSILIVEVKYLLLLKCVFIN